MMSQSTNCPICGSYKLTLFLERKQTPVHQNQIFTTYEAARKVVRGDLQLVVCEGCGFVTNMAFDLAKLQYNQTYDNTQTCSTMFLEHVDHLVRRIADSCQMNQPRIVEVGCGKGLFLRKLLELVPNAIGYGFDTAYVGPLEDLNGRLHFYQRYYEIADIDIDADIIICRHVIEHVPDPRRFLLDIRRSLTGATATKFYLETPCVEWILKNYIIWDFFYEHCSYFSADTLTTAFASSGFQVNCVDYVFGGQYLWLEASLSIGNSEPVKKYEGTISEIAQQFAKMETWIKDILATSMYSRSTAGKVALWGAGAKGTTLANLIDPDGDWITCIVDLNPGKQQMYLAGSGHPIVSYRQLPELGVTTLFNMNSNYFEENLQLLRNANLKIDLLDLADWMQASL
jgi:SAM-dependent methyltransferase